MPFLLEGVVENTASQGQQKDLLALGPALPNQLAPNWIFGCCDCYRFQHPKKLTSQWDDPLTEKRFKNTKINKGSALDLETWGCPTIFFALHFLFEFEFEYSTTYANMIKYVLCYCDIVYTYTQFHTYIIQHTYYVYIYIYNTYTSLIICHHLSIIYLSSNRYLLYHAKTIQGPALGRLQRQLQGSKVGPAQQQRRHGTLQAPLFRLTPVAPSWPPKITIFQGESHGKKPWELGKPMEIMEKTMETWEKNYGNHGKKPIETEREAGLVKVGRFWPFEKPRSWFAMAIFMVEWKANYGESQANETEDRGIKLKSSHTLGAPNLIKSCKICKKDDATIAYTVKRWFMHGHSV